MTPLNSIFLKSSGPLNIGNIVQQFNIVDTLYSRGFINITEANIEETLLSKEVCPMFAEFQNSIYRMEFMENFKDKKFRTGVKKIIYEGLHSTNNEIKKYGFVQDESYQNRFTKTVELLIAYLCVKELKAFSASFGIKMDGTPDGGDYDCISNFQNQLVYFEVKSGKRENIKPESLQYFLYRHSFLAPYFSVLFVDYEGGNDKLDLLVKQFKSLKIDDKNKAILIRKVTIGSQKFYIIGPDIIVVDIHKGSILSNLRLAMQYIHRYNAYSRNMSYINIPPDFLGYEYVEL